MRSGLAPFRYVPGFLSGPEASGLFERLQISVPWQQEWLTLYGQRIPVPRLLAWCGSDGLNYRYSGTDHVCRGWMPELGELRRRLEAEAGVASNFVLINRYRHGDDYMGWHADDERGLASVVASITLGAERRFLLRLPGCDRSVPLDLQHGSLLVLDGALQHTLPRTRRRVGERINLTFRRIEPALRRAS